MWKNDSWKGEAMGKPRGGIKDRIERSGKRGEGGGGVCFCVREQYPAFCPTELRHLAWQAGIHVCIFRENVSLSKLSCFAFFVRQFPLEILVYLQIRFVALMTAFTFNIFISYSSQQKNATP